MKKRKPPFCNTIGTTYGQRRGVSGYGRMHTDRQSGMTAAFRRSCIVMKQPLNSGFISRDCVAKHGRLTSVTIQHSGSNGGSVIKQTDTAPAAYMLRAARTQRLHQHRGTLIDHPRRASCSISGRTGPPGTCQVGRLVRRPSGPPSQTLKEGVERRSGPFAREGGRGPRVSSCATAHGAGLSN